MKILANLLPLFLINCCLFAQFDRINLDPVSSNPSYTGSISKNRISFMGEYYFNSGIFNQNNSELSYDFFSNKLKGGWGISARLMETDLNSSEYQEYNLSYSPKLTFNNTGVTWAPSLRVSYHRNKIEIVDFNEKSMGFAIGFNRNTKNSLAGGYVEFNLYEKWGKYALDYSYKFDKNKFNNVSSTLFVSPQLNYRYAEDLSDGRTGFDSDDEGIYLDNRWSFLTTFENDFNDISTAKNYVRLLLSYTYRRDKVSATVENTLFLSEKNNSLIDNTFTNPNLKLGYHSKNLDLMLDLSFLLGTSFRAGAVYKFGKGK